MFSSCLSIGEPGWYYEDSTHISHHTHAAAVACFECGSVIKAGTDHDYYAGTSGCDTREAGERDEIHTCRTCMNIWESLTGGDRRFGDLADLLMDAYGTPLDRVPEDDVEEDWDSLVCQYSFDKHSLEAAAQPKGQPKISRALAGLHLLEEFVHPEQHRAMFEWVTSVGLDSNEEIA